jgi:hypothetical protein
MILGLDVSTRCVGWALLNDDETIFKHGYISLSKVNFDLDKAEKVRHIIGELADKHKITRVGIEDILQKSSTGSAKTITVLAGFNGIVRYICFKIFGKHPESVRFCDARKTFKIKREGKEKMKVAVHRYISGAYENSFLTEYNRNDNIRPESMDSSDAVLIAKYLCRTDKETNEKRRTSKGKTRAIQTNK